MMRASSQAWRDGQTMPTTLTARSKTRSLISYQCCRSCPERVAWKPTTFKAQPLSVQIIFSNSSFLSAHSKGLAEI